MKYEIREIKDGVCQLTTSDERFYFELDENGQHKKDKDGNLIWYPSVTYITHFYPKGIEYIRWIGNKGFDQAEQIKIEAGDRGTIVHHACEKLLKEKSLKMDDKLKDRDGVEREMTGDEYWAALTFHKWYQETKPLIYEIESTVINRTDRYAGTLDLMVGLKDKDGIVQYGIVDIKTSPNIWPSHELQVSALQRAWEDEHKTDKVLKKLGFRAILQVGYKRNKNGYKFTEIEDNYKEFMSVKNIWAKETEGDKPLQRDFPTEITI